MIGDAVQVTPSPLDLATDSPKSAAAAKAAKGKPLRTEMVQKGAKAR
jgi:hypothetical protein